MAEREREREKERDRETERQRNRETEKQRDRETERERERETHTQRDAFRGARALKGFVSIFAAPGLLRDSSRRQGS